MSPLISGTEATSADFSTTALLNIQPAAGLLVHRSSATQYPTFAPEPYTALAPGATLIAQAWVRRARAIVSTPASAVRWGSAATGEAMRAWFGVPLLVIQRMGLSDCFLRRSS